MNVFVSYSRRDHQAVKTVLGDLERARWTSWMDNALGGGEDWWREILQQIRSCDVFVLALSHNSVRSRPCLAELEYAMKLGVPVLPLQIGHVDSLRMTPIADRQVVDYRPRLALTDQDALRASLMIDLVVAAADLAEQRQPLAGPLPAEPPIPFEYLMQISLALDAPELPGQAQRQILTQLRQAWRDEEDAAARQDVLDLLRRLRRHPEATYRVALDVDEILATEPDVAEDAPSPDVTDDDAVPDSPDAPDDPAPMTEAVSSPLLPNRLVDPAPYWSLAAAIVGTVGIAQAGPLAFYEMSFVFPGYAVRSQPFLTTMIVILVGSCVGVAAGVRAAFVKQRWSGAALTVALVGLLVVVGVLFHYRNVA